MMGSGGERGTGEVINITQYFELEKEAVESVASTSKSGKKESQRCSVPASNQRPLTLAENFKSF